jgi:hypothetical protein
VSAAATVGTTDSTIAATRTIESNRLFIVTSFPSAPGRPLFSLIATAHMALYTAVAYQISVINCSFILSYGYYFRNEIFHIFMIPFPHTVSGGICQYTQEKFAIFVEPVL